MKFIVAPSVHTHEAALPGTQRERERERHRKAPSGTQGAIVYWISVFDMGARVGPTKRRHIRRLFLYRLDHQTFPFLGIRVVTPLFRPHRQRPLLPSCNLKRRQAPSIG